MKKCSKLLFLIFSLLFSFMIASCATTLRVEVTRPGNLDLNGIKTIAVLPFEKSEFSPFDYIFDYEEKEELNYWEYYNLIQNTEDKILSYLQNNLEKSISSSPYVDLVDYTPVEHALKYRNKLPCDAYISGEVVTFKIHDILSKEKKPIKESNVVVEDNVIESLPAEGNGQAPIPNEPKPDFYYEFSYTREVQFIFNYKIVDGKTNQLISYDTIKIEQMSDTVKDKKDLPNIYSMVTGEIDNFIYTLMRDIQPYKEYKSITLLEDNTKNPRMEEADKLAKDKSYKASYHAYLSIYNDINQFEAGYNAAMLLMAMGDLQGAEELMSEVYENFGNPKALEGLNDIRREIKMANRLNKQISNE